MIKTISAASALALVLGVTPSAMAQMKDAENARTYTISVEGGAVPATLDNLTYPYSAASRGMSGSCDIALNADNSDRSYQVVSCSHGKFLKAAAEYAETLRHRETAAAETLKVVWDIEG